jgi:hypothetical protein
LDLDSVHLNNIQRKILQRLYETSRGLEWHVCAIVNHECIQGGRSKEILKAKGRGFHKLF